MSQNNIRETKNTMATMLHAETADTPRATRMSRECLVDNLRRAFGDAPDSPTLPYYRELPIAELEDAYLQADSMRARMTRGLVGGSFGTVALVVGLATDFKTAVVGGGVAAGVLFYDMLKKNRDLDVLKSEVLSRAP